MPERQRHGRQEQVAKLVERVVALPEGRQPAEPDREDEDAEDRREVDRGADADEGEERAGVVDGALAPAGLEHAQRDADSDRDEDRQRDELERDAAARATMRSPTSWRSL